MSDTTQALADLEQVAVAPHFLRPARHAAELKAAVCGPTLRSRLDVS